jgi:hypothetical protein
MSIRTAFVAAALAAMPAAALAQDDTDYTPACTAPIAPVNIGADSHDAVTAFIAASDSYQQCLGRALGARQDIAFFAKTNVPPSVVKQIEGKARDNQRQKEEVGRAYNAAVRTTAP